MKKYKTKSKMFGYKIGMNDDHIYIAVAKKYFDGERMDGVVEINCDGEKKIVTVEDKVREITFKDKYHPESNYTLYYFKWSD